MTRLVEVGEGRQWETLLEKLYVSTTHFYLGPGIGLIGSDWLLMRQIHDFFRSDLSHFRPIGLALGPNQTSVMRMSVDHVWNPTTCDLVDIGLSALVCLFPSHHYRVTGHVYVRTMVLDDLLLPIPVSDHLSCYLCHNNMNNKWTAVQTCPFAKHRAMLYCSPFQLDGYLFVETQYGFVTPIALFSYLRQQ